MTYRIGSIVLLCLMATRAPSAQSTSRPSTEASEVSAGWAAMAAGNPTQASTIASTAMARYPGSLPVGILAVQSQLMRSGSTAALATYEQWLGTRSAEAPYLLRLVALGLLREAVIVTSASQPQRRALEALLAEGDDTVAAALAPAQQSGNIVATEGLAALGDEASVRSLIGAMQRGVGDRSPAIRALGATRSPLAVRPLIDVLSDPLSSNQMAAATALGALGFPEAITPLRPLLRGHVFAVEFAAAAALFRLHDAAGISFLRGLQTSESPMIRAQTLEAMAAEPDAAWMAGVRDLLDDADPQVRILAARLLAPHDPAAAAASMRQMFADPNIAVAEAANIAYADRVVNDIAGLRQLLKNADALIRVNAAARVLELTR